MTVCWNVNLGANNFILKINLSTEGGLCRQVRDCSEIVLFLTVQHALRVFSTTTVVSKIVLLVFQSRNSATSQHWRSKY